METCPIPQITDQLGKDTATTPSPLHFDWTDESVVGIPRQLIHQIHRYDFSFPTGSYAGKLFLQGQKLVWIRQDSFDPEKLVYAYCEYKEIGEYDPNPHLEPCPLCNGEAYSAFEARSTGDTVKFHITCMDCQLTFGNEYKFPLKRAIDYSVNVNEQWNTRAGKEAQRIDFQTPDVLRSIKNVIMDRSLLRKDYSNRYETQIVDIDNDDAESIATDIVLSIVGKETNP